MTALQKRGTHETETDDDTFELLGLAALVLVHRLGKNRRDKSPSGIGATAPLDTGQLLVDPRKSFVERGADDDGEELPPPALIGSGGR